MFSYSPSRGVTITVNPVLVEPVDRVFIFYTKENVSDKVTTTSTITC